MPKSRSGLLISFRDLNILDAKRIAQKLNRDWTSIVVEASKLRAVPEERRDFLFWSRCSCWRHSVWRFQDILHFCKDVRFFDTAKYVAFQGQLQELVRDVERGDCDARI